MDRAARSFRIGGPAAASLLVNGLLIAALLNLSMGHVSRRAESPSLTVLSLALLKGDERSQEETAAATPNTAVVAPSPSTKPEPVLRPSALSPVAPPVIPPPPRITLAVPVQAVAAVASSVAAPPRPTAASASSSTSTVAPPSRHGAVDGLDIKAPPGTSRSYAAKVRSWLYAHKIYPRRARMRREEGQVQVRFVLDRAGMLLEGVIVRGSGNAVLDEEATAMMRRASPYPRAPVELPGERIEFTVPIEFTMPI
jgi:protein TonB